MNLSSIAWECKEIYWDDYLVTDSKWSEKRNATSLCVVLELTEPQEIGEIKIGT